MRPGPDETLTDACDGRWPAAVWRVGIQRLRIPVRSGFLALWTLESVVPLATLTAAILGWVGHRDLMLQSVDAALDSSVFGGTTQPASAWLTQVLDSVTLGQLGAFGVVSVLFVVYQLYVAVLFDVNEILGDGRSDRSWLAHAALFLPFVVWVSLLLVGGMVATGWMYQTGQFLLLAAMYPASALLLSVGPWMLCHHPPKVRYLLGGALVGALWLEALKMVFFLYSTSSIGADTLRTTYQQLAFLPLVFLWMHLVWFSVLLGLVVARVASVRVTEESGGVAGAGYPQGNP